MPSDAPAASSHTSDGMTQVHGPRPQTTPAQDLPLAGLFVIELSDGLCDGAGRILADLGAYVVKVEPPEGAPTRRRGVFDGPDNLTFAANNANKRSVTIDVGSSGGRRELLRLIRSADLVLAGGPGSQDLPAEADLESLWSENPSLVVLRMSWFGATGPYRDWTGSGDVLSALSGLLAQSGLPEREPLLPPVHLVDASASAQAAWTAMLALWKRHVTGRGELIDFSALEAVAISLDPAFGIGGTARGAAMDLPHGRPDAGHLYPTFACADGWARICLLSGRQWDNMLEWMGHPDELSDPKYRILRERHTAASVIMPMLGAFFATRTRDQIVNESLKYGVPAAGLLDAHEVMNAPHFVARNTFVDVPLSGSRSARMPRAFVEIDGIPAGFRQPAPAIGEHTGDPIPPTHRSTSGGTGTTSKPFAGLRVLDLGVIVVGAESGRLFADWGADVIKIENRQYPDGNRQSVGPDTVTPSFARGHRNKRSLGINLRSESGKKLFLDLARESDVVLSNFKPGTLESLGLSPDVLLNVNPRLIVADSSAFGATGPWSKRMGYGPLVRASTGLSPLWSYGDADGGFSDAITIYPDHVAARFVALAVIAMLLRRSRTGVGGTASVAQTDVVLGHMADLLMAESIRPNALKVAGNFRDGDSPRGLFPCAGNDNWCVVDVQNDAQFRGLAEAINKPDWLTRPEYRTAEGRLAQRDLIEGALLLWTQRLPPRDAMRLLQQHGVPAGFMQRAIEFHEDPQFTARGFLRPQEQSQFPEPLMTQDGEAFFSTMGRPLSGPAPVHGEHTHIVCSEVLGLSQTEIDELIGRGILEAPSPANDDS